MKIKEIVPLWVEYKKNYVKRSSMSSYVLLTENHILPAFGEHEAVEECDVQDFVLKKINSGLSQKTTKDILIVLKMIIKFGNKRKLIELIEWDLNFPKENFQKTMEVFTINDHKKIISFIKGNITFRNLGILITLSTGLRIGEVCALTWEDIDTDRGILTVNKTIQRIYVVEDGKRRTELIIDTPKTKTSQRQVPLSKDLLQILKPLKKVLNANFFVLTNDEKPTEPRTYRVYYDDLMQKLGMPRLNFHGMRHTFATRCINAKIDVKTVSVLLGHSNISTTLNTYVHPNLEQKQSAIDQMFKSMK